MALTTNRCFIEILLTKQEVSTIITALETHIKKTKTDSAEEQITISLLAQLWTEQAKMQDAVQIPSAKESDNG